MEHKTSALTQGEDDERLEKPRTRPLKLADGRNVELVGVYEAAQIIGVERWRFARWLSPLRKWRNAGCEGPPPRLTIPQPVADLGCGPIWVRSDIEAFAQNFARWGRPTRSA
jgi:hypothetical protein